MKKTISAVLVAAMLFGTNAFAAERTLTDAAKGIVKISGKAQSGATVSILVTNPGYTYETADQTGARQYMQSFKTTADGSYEHNVVLNMDDVSSGYFKIYVKEGNAAVVELKELYFASVEQKYTEMKRVIEDTSLIGTDETVKNVFGLNESLYAAVDMSKIASSLKDYLTENSIEINDDDTNDMKLEKFGVLSATIKEITVLEAYNEGKSGVLFDSSNNFEYDDILGLSTLDSDKGITIYALYTDSLNDTGRSNVREDMLNKNVRSISELQRIFAKSVMLNGIENHKDQGYGHISDYITTQNIHFATDTTGSTAVDTYLNLQDKTNANYTIKKHTSEITMDNILSKVEYYAQNPESPGSEKPGSGSDSGGGGGSSKADLTISVPAKDPTENEEKTNTAPETKDEHTASGIFSDVYDDYWGKTAIEYLYKKGVINGMTENIFGPNDNLTREQGVKILCAAFDITDIKDLYYENGVTYDRTDYTMFDDVTQYDWYGEYVFAAYRNGVVKGISDRLFGVGSNVTRQDIAVMIYRALKQTVSGETLPFADAADVSDYAKEAVSYMKSNKIIEGYEDNTFRPNNFITRAEIAQIVYRILNKEG